MPEGDTIFRTARTLNKALAGRVVTEFEAAVAKLARVDDDTPIAGRTVQSVEARGKWCLIHLSGGDGGSEPLILLSHMLMNGSWHLYRTGERWKIPRKNMRVVIRTDAFEAVLFSAQIAEFHTARSLLRSSQVPRLGPDLLADDFSVESGIARLEEYARQHPAAEVGVVLLNQRVIAGMGNVYKSEVAFAARVNPWRQVGSLKHAELERLVDFALRYLKANVQADAGDAIVTYTGQRRTTQRMNEGERLWVYGRAGEECRRCGTRIVEQKQGEDARVTFWCPECQPLDGSGRQGH